MRTMLMLVALLGIAPHLTMAAAPVEKGAQEFATGYDLLKQQKYQESRMAFEAGLQQNPANAMAHFFLGDACRNLKAWACAEEHYETSIELDGKSTVIELAKQRLRKAKVWRRLEEGERKLNETNVTEQQMSQALDTLEIANKLGLGDEEQAIYQILQQKIAILQQNIAQKQEEISTSIKQKQLADTRSKNLQALRRLEGKWKFANREAVYKAAVNNRGTLEFRIERTDPILLDAGVKIGDRALWDFQVETAPNLYRLYGDDVTRQDQFRDSVETFAVGFNLLFYTFNESADCRTKKGYIKVKTLLAYFSSTDRIRVIPLERLADSHRHTCDLGLEDNHYQKLFTGKDIVIEEMIRE